jgi:hypothetical protein
MTDYSHNPDYRLEKSRWHLLEHPETSERRFGIGGNQSSARMISGQHGVKIAQAFHTSVAEAERTFGLAEQGKFKEAAHGNPDAARQLETFYRSKLEGKITPDDIRIGLERIQEFAPKLTAQVLEGKHGDQPYSAALARHLHALSVRPMDGYVDQATFTRPERQNFEAPGGRYGIELSPYTVGRFHKQSWGRDGTSTDFYGAPYMLSPEGLYAHEYAHALDYLLTNLKAPDERHHDPNIARRGQAAGLKMAHGLDWQHIHDGLQKYTQLTPSGILGIPTLPQPLTRLHYPTVGYAAPGDSIYQATQTHPNPLMAQTARERVIRMSEWPTVTTELMMHAPDSLEALDAVFGRDAKGRGARQIVNDFWGFNWPGEMHPDHARQIATSLRQTLENGSPERGFISSLDASSALHPHPLLGGSTIIRGYAAGMNSSDELMTTKFGDRLKPPEEMEYGQPVAIFTPTEAQFQRVYHDLRTFGTISDGLAYLSLAPLEGNKLYHTTPDPKALAAAVLGSYRSGLAFDVRDAWELEALPVTPPRW